MDVDKAVDTAQKVADKIPSLKEQAEGVLQSIINAAIQTGEFIKDQIPQVIKELLMFNMATDIVWILACSGVMFVSYKLLRYLIKNDNKECIPFLIIMMIPSVFFFFVNLIDLLKIWLAPRVWLIEYAAKLMKGSN